MRGRGRDGDKGIVVEHSDDAARRRFRCGERSGGGLQDTSTLESNGWAGKTLQIPGPQTVLL